MQTSRLATKCYHCGNEFQAKISSLEEKAFCCSGCQSVYELLNENNLCNYYELNEHPGQFIQKEIRKEKYAFLEDPKIQAQLIQFQNKNFTHLTFYIPQIHCSSCLFLLENIYKFDSGIISSYVNFERKEVFIQFNNEKTSLRNVVETLEKIGYEPHLSLKGFESARNLMTRLCCIKLVLQDLHLPIS
jgi:Cu+-exporting ATPase